MKYSSGQASLGALCALGQWKRERAYKGILWKKMDTDVKMYPQKSLTYIRVIRDSEWYKYLIISLLHPRPREDH